MQEVPDLQGEVQINLGLIVGFALGYGVRASGFPADDTKRRNGNVANGDGRQAICALKPQARQCHSK